jgi:sugar phosphate isomerase/epimerase
MANHPRVGTLPDFGNFRLQGDEWYDRYQGVTELMPYAKAVSAKSHEFNDAGEEVHTDYHRMLRIVKDAGYRGHIGIEYEGSQHDEDTGIRMTRDLLLRVRDELS